jgi:hypothetical protein
VKFTIPESELIKLNEFKTALDTCDTLVKGPKNDKVAHSDLIRNMVVDSIRKACCHV